MAGEILTEVSATVEPGRTQELVDGYRKLADSPLPAGLLYSRLLRGDQNRWQIQTMWRDRGALDAMRAGSEPPAAPALFQSVGAEPVLGVLTVVAELAG
ncbi:hypothetical protein EV651_105369 [Kribbella sp. VKM Ac-2571]|uniref:hypothetical protein n=1 Tax=Kribbella sp. VKM Ac-2571 TaxID=2512222 RepID=UPI001060997A|nr:hypothetical protein [Kribbella sp. VKM Ac-2571]TDO64145.1 hypothetical protein EV651_105369 [Kribbella sp. VKM Ac-2571]